jgi:thiamine-phosphate pyrophosphorylase
MQTSCDLSVYLVTDRRLCGVRGIVETAREAAKGGVSMVQLRDPLASTRTLIEEARALIAHLRPLGVQVIINDRVDVAMITDADGVHLGQGDMTPSDARVLLGADKIIGLSVGTPDELAASAQELNYVDYIGTGPIHPTHTKVDAGDSIGIGGFHVLRKQTQLPMVAIGGLTLMDAADLIEAGADGIAVSSAICSGEDPCAAARCLVEAVMRSRNERAA